jgi:hypothetical protein
MFTDKEYGQINAIESVWNGIVRLCFWHVQQAVHRKIKDKKCPQLPASLGPCLVEFPFVKENWIQEM